MGDLIPGVVLQYIPLAFSNTTLVASSAVHMSAQANKERKKRKQGEKKRKKKEKNERDSNSGTVQSLYRYKASSDHYLHIAQTHFSRTWGVYILGASESHNMCCTGVNVCVFITTLCSICRLAMTERSQWNCSHYFTAQTSAHFVTFSLVYCICTLNISCDKNIIFISVECSIVLLQFCYIISIRTA